MKSLKITLAILFLMLAATAGASAIPVTTIGDRSCGKWVKDKEDRQQTNGAHWYAENLNHTWLTGYLSGLAVANNIDFLSKPDGDSIFLWVDKYCAANPLKPVADAAMYLMFELTKK